MHYITLLLIEREYTSNLPSSQMKCRKLYNKPAPPDLSLDELTNALFNHISSQNSNEQLQDMVGGSNSEECTA